MTQFAIFTDVIPASPGAEGARAQAGIQTTKKARRVRAAHIVPGPRSALRCASLAGDDIVMRGAV